MARVRSEPAVFGNTVFVLTSHVGTATVEKWTRKRLQSLSTGDQGGRPGDFSKTVAAAGAPEVDSLLRYEIKKHHATTSRTGGHAMIIDDWLLVPMAPIGLVIRIASITPRVVVWVRLAASAIVEQVVGP